MKKSFGCWGQGALGNRTGDVLNVEERRYAARSSSAFEGFSCCLHAFSQWRSVNEVFRQLSKQGA